MNNLVLVAIGFWLVLIWCFWKAYRYGRQNPDSIRVRVSNVLVYIVVGYALLVALRVYGVWLVLTWVFWKGWQYSRQKVSEDRRWVVIAFVVFAIVWLTVPFFLFLFGVDGFGNR
jgi:hypothetical protein